MPLAWLAGLIVCACVLSYGILQLSGEFVSLDKVISKATQFLLIISIFPLKKLLGLSWRSLGFAERNVFFKQVYQGMLLALITLLPVLMALYILHVHVFDDTRLWTAAKFAEKIGLGLLLALLIALFEEILFRGVLLTSLRQKMGAVAAIGISSFYYAALHFLKSSSTIAYADMTPASGFKLMAEAFGNWLNPAIFSAWLALFVVGVFLAVLRSRIPHSIGLCIGCHCGWVWQIKLSKDLFNVNPNADYLYLVSNYDGVVGPLVAGWLAMAIVLFWLISKHYSGMNFSAAAVAEITH
ncbi:CPBP family intramembrane metalloprotease [Methylomonas paludis]|uniref:CPBP family intramembrane metalloprotease n=2 Tax=Methylomonas paludis TaxID=1173101 RepID=A0A975RAG6_9GAMM|nr:CPBP family intramembrane metalloprotease [Methylomonas paludis]